MEKEGEIDAIERIYCLENILRLAWRNATFGEDLRQLSSDDLKLLTRMLSSSDQYEAGSMFRPARRKILKLFGKALKCDADREELVKKLDWELKIALGAIAGRPVETDETRCYFEEFIRYINRLGEDERGEIITESNVRRFVIAEKLDTVRAYINADGKLVISTGNYNWENLSLVQKWLPKVMENVGFKLMRSVYNDAKEKQETFLQQFRTDVLGLGFAKIGHNINEWTLTALLEAGDKQIAPRENSGKVMLSINSSFDDNLAFLRENIVEAMHMYHLKR